MKNEKVLKKFESSGKTRTKKVNEVEQIKEIEKQKQINQNKKFFNIVIITIIIIFILVLSTIFALINMNNNTIMSGIKIQNIDVSGLTREEAKEKLNVIYDEKLKKNITLEYQDYQLVINPSSLNITYDIEEAIDKAYEIGRNSNIFINNYNIIFALLGKENIKIDMSISEENLSKMIDGINSEIPEAMEEVNYYIEENKLIITKGKEGIRVNSDELKERIQNILNSTLNIQYYIKIPVENKKPNDIDIDKIYKEVYKEVKDAYYTKDPFTLYPEVQGIDFNKEEAKSIIASEDKNEYIIPLVITEPKVKMSNIGTEAFPDLLGTFTTRYDESDIDRATNLKIACNKINEKVILPEEIFSYNKTLGERTIAAGYKNAKVYENGQVVNGIGGGICQISSTLYNTVLQANLQIVERRNHQFITSYVPTGQDATVVYGLIDFKFKNSRKYAVKIKASASNGIATISIYGIKEETEYAISVETKVLSSIPYTVKYIEDSSLAVGTEKIKQKGAYGYVTETYLVKKLNGNVVSRELLSKDTYNAMQRIIAKGTKVNN